MKRMNAVLWRRRPLRWWERMKRLDDKNPAVMALSGASSDYGGAL